MIGWPIIAQERVSLSLRGFVRGINKNVRASVNVFFSNGGFRALRDGSVQRRRFDDIARQLLRPYDRSACHDTKHKRGRRLSSLDMQISVITITNRAQADIMESRDCNVRCNQHICDTRTNQRTDSPSLSLSLSLFLS